jgi:hypothetical protein
MFSQFNLTSPASVLGVVLAQWAIGLLGSLEFGGCMCECICCHTSALTSAAGTCSCRPLMLPLQGLHKADKLPFRCSCSYFVNVTSYADGGLCDKRGGWHVQFTDVERSSEVEKVVT